MGTLKTTVTLSSSDLTTANLASSTVKDLTVTQGGILLKEVEATTDGAAVLLLGQADHAEGTKVYIRNKHASNTLNVKFTATVAQVDLVIGAGEWAFFPWKAAVDITVWASAADTMVEYGTFV